MKYEYEQSVEILMRRMKEDCSLEIQTGNGAAIPFRTVTTRHGYAATAAKCARLISFDPNFVYNLSGFPEKDGAK